MTVTSPITSTTVQPPTGTLENVDPHNVHVGDNVRDDAALNEPFVASVAEHGVLQPITAVRTPNGIEVRDGQRRTLAARRAGLATIPVYVLECPEEASTATAARITHQIVSNDQRAELTDAQRVKGEIRKPQLALELRRCGHDQFPQIADTHDR